MVAERTLSYLQAKIKQTDTVTKSAKLSDLFRDRATIKGLIIVCGLFLGQQLGGIFAMVIVNNYLATFSISSSHLNVNQLQIPAHRKRNELISISDFFVHSSAIQRPSSNYPAARYRRT